MTNIFSVGDRVRHINCADTFVGEITQIAPGERASHEVKWDEGGHSIFHDVNMLRLVSPAAKTKFFVVQITDRGARLRGLRVNDSTAKGAAETWVKAFGDIVPQETGVKIQVTWETPQGNAEASFTVQKEVKFIVE